jgi:hypothetical protein
LITIKVAGSSELVRSSRALLRSAETNMASAQAVIVGVRAADRTGASARPLHEIVVALVIATLFAGLWGVYFAVNAGESYPEPYTIVAD